MLFRTHVAIGAFVAILFSPLTSNPVEFFIITLIASILPDLDSGFKNFKGNFGFKSHGEEHKGFSHSITLCLLLSISISVFFPKLAFGFFLGYSIHLLADSFSAQGITPFWPLKSKAHGVLKVGGMTEKGIFFVFVLLDLALFFIYFL